MYIQSMKKCIYRGWRNKELVLKTAGMTPMVFTRTAKLLFPLKLVCAVQVLITFFSPH